MEFDVVLPAGLALGSVYALVGVAVSVVGLATQRLHLAIGAVLAAGTLTVLTLRSELVGWDPLVALACGVAVAVVLSSLLEPLVLRFQAGELEQLVGLAVAAGLIDAVLARTLGARTLVPAPLVDLEPVSLGGTTVPGPVVVAVVMGLPASFVLLVLLRRSRWGRRVRLVGGSMAAARQAGIAPTRVRAGAFAVSGLAAVTAGLLIAPVTFTAAGQGTALTVRGVAAAVLAGSSRPALVIPVGLGLGLAEAAAQRVWPGAGGDLVVVGIILTVLVAVGTRSRTVGRAW